MLYPSLQQCTPHSLTHRTYFVDPSHLQLTASTWTSLPRRAEDTPPQVKPKQNLKQVTGADSNHYIAIDFMHVSFDLTWWYLLHVYLAPFRRCGAVDIFIFISV